MNFFIGDNGFERSMPAHPQVKCQVLTRVPDPFLLGTLTTPGFDNLSFFSAINGILGTLKFVYSLGRQNFICEILMLF